MQAILQHLHENMLGRGEGDENVSARGLLVAYQQLLEDND